MPDGTSTTAAAPPTITRVGLRNYKSIPSCDVELSPLTILVGPNGAGKSNFLDALRFTSQALRFSLDHALRERGGINEVRRRSRGHPNHFGIRSDFRLPETHGWYSFEVGAKPLGRYIVRKEECVTVSAGIDRSGTFRVENGQAITSSFSHPPGAGSDRLYLMQVAGYPPFRPVYDALSGMGFYNFHPEQIRELQSPDPGELLKPDGSNIASPDISPTFVARASRRRCDGPHGPKDAEGVVDTTSKRLEGVRPVTAHGSASAAESW